MTQNAGVAIHRAGKDSIDRDAGIDLALVARAQRGDVAAFEALFRGCADRVFALCLRMCGDRGRATELAHDAFVHAWERLGSFRGDAAFESWMHRLTVNVVLQAERSRKRRAAHEVEGEEDAVAASPLRAATIDERIDLEQAIAQLSPNARQVFVLHDVEGYRHDEIADRMQLAAGTVRAHLHRARQQLIRMLNR